MPSRPAVQPVAKRRGVDPDLIGSWESVLLHGDIAAWTAALEKGGGTVRTGADVTRQVLSGKLAAPRLAKWVVLVQLRGHDWLQAGPFDADTAERLAKQTKRRTMHVGHQDTASATFARLFDARQCVVSFESADEFFFHSKRHPPGWKKQFKDDADALLDALVRGEDAFVPGFWVGESNGKIQLQCGQDDVLTPANVEQVALVVLASNRKEDAAKLLYEAVIQCEPARVREAISLGASPNGEFLLEQSVRWIVGGQRPKEAREVFDLLVAAGADLGGPPPAASYLCDATGLPDEPSILAAIDALYAAGADLNVTGTKTKRSPMSFASACGAMKAIQRLEDFGLSTTARDAARKLPLQRAEEERRKLEWAPEVYRKRLKQLDAVIAHLERAGDGEAKPASPIPRKVTASRRSRRR